MRDEVFMVGLGGQGVVLAGNILAQAVMEAGMQVSWFPLYSPEVRGGEATCTVVMADERVGSPVAGQYSIALLFDEAGAKNYGHKVAPGGTAIVNIDFAKEPLGRDDIRVVEVNANQLAVASGSEKAVNMVMLGAFCAACNPPLLDAIIGALKSILPERHHKFLPMNEAALRAGAAAVK